MGMKIHLNVDGWVGLGIDKALAGLYCVRLYF